MTRTPAPALSSAEAAIVARFDAAPTPPEVVVETVARAILHAVLGDTDGGLVLEGDLPAGEIARLITEYGAGAAIAAMPPSPAEEAVKRVDALAVELEQPPTLATGAWHGLSPRAVARRIRAALASPAPAPQAEERLCLCGKPETDSVHHRPQTSEEEHTYEPAPTAAEYYGAAR